jgi:hypothetical protein
MKAKIPHFSLDRVKALVVAGRFMIQEGRALAFLGTYKEATASMREVIANLSTKNFSNSVQLTWDMADVYGFGSGM